MTSDTSRPNAEIGTEEIESIAKLFRANARIAAMGAATTQSARRLSRTALQHVVGRVQTEARRGHWGRVHDWVLLSALVTDGAILRENRFADALRPSVTAPSQLTNLNKTLVRLESSLRSNGQNRSADRVQAWAEFVRLFQLTRDADRKLLAGMRDLPHSLQYVLSVVEERFLVDADQPRSQIGCSSLDELAKEEVASAASYAIARYRDVYGVDGRDIAGASFTWGDDRRPMDLARDLVLLAFRLNRVRDVEASVYRMSYSCKCEGQLAFTVLPPVERFGMALELGYIRTAMMARPALDHPQPEAARFSDLCNGWVTRFGDQYLRIAEGPPRRLQLAIHEPVARILGQELLLSQGMFAEDVLALESECYELGTTGETLDQIRVTEHLTLFDLFRVHRLFRFVAVVRRAKLNELREAEPPAYLNSLLGGISREDLVQLLEAHGLSPAQAREYLDLVTWDASAGNAFLDLQYSPFLQVGDLLCLPFALHARSDVVRNTLFRTKARIYADGTQEPMVVDLADAFRGRTNTVETNVDYGAGLGEIDVVALLDDGLYIFECKNTLLPTSAFEQRTLHDYLEKASMQLDRFRTAWEDRAVRSALKQKLGWDLAGA